MVSAERTKSSQCSIKPRPNALDFSLYIARELSSIVECCREGVAKRSRRFTQHACRALYSERSRAFGQGFKQHIRSCIQLYPMIANEGHMRET